MSSKSIVLLFGVFAAFIFLTQSFFIVPQTNQAVVLQFGAFVREVKEPGLFVKMPFVQNVMIFEKRILELDPPETPVLLSDQLRINIDAYARYRIVDPFKFYISAYSEEGLNNRFGPTISNKIRNELSRATLPDMLSEKRDDIMKSILDSVRIDAGNFGIEVVDLRIGRTELPLAVSQSTFARMRADREQRAKEARAVGAEKSLQIRASADKERVLLLAEANKQAEILRGQGDAGRTRLLGDAFGRDPRFFEFYRTMQAYRESLGNGDATLVLSPDHEFMKYFK